MSDVPLDLRAWRRVDPPKYKKDYPGKMLRMLEQPMSAQYERVDGKLQYEKKPDALVPPGTVLTLRTRWTHGTDAKGQSQEILVCNWLCPCCGHKHERSIQGSWLAEGKIEFVEEADTLDQTIRPVIYLAAPYSHPDPAVRQSRWLAVCEAAAWLIGKGSSMFASGYTVYSPISMGHPISVVGAAAGLRYDAAGWELINGPMLDAATHMVVLDLDGLRSSAGVEAEVAFARKKGLPVWRLNRDEKGHYRMTLRPQFDFSGVRYE